MRTALMAAALMMAAAPANADMVSDWMAFTNKIAMPYQSSAGAPRTPDQERAATRAALAMFEALTALDRRYESYLKFPAATDRSASPDAAAATAVHRVLLQHFPAQKAALDERYAKAMAAIPDEKRRTAGQRLGEAAAQAAMAAGGIDPAIPQPPYVPHTTPGVWVATALPSIDSSMTAYRPWAIPSAEALRSPPPPALSSERWARDYNEVKRLGGKVAPERTPRQTAVARLRIGPDVAPALRLAADSPGRTALQNARMFLLHQMALDDAVIAMTAAKLHYNFWRPITAIRGGADDGNPATTADPTWLPVLPTPNFPEYPCGHCMFAGAVAEVMTAEVGPKPATGVQVGSQMSPDAPIDPLPSWDDWVREVNDSRIYAGAHFRFANEAGEAIGRQAARAVLAKVARPLRARASR